MHYSCCKYFSVLLALLVCSCGSPQAAMQERLIKADDLIKKKHFSLAIKELKTLHDIDPRFKEADYMTGKAYFYQKNYGMAIRQLRDIIDQSDVKQEYWEYLIRSYGEIKSFRTAYDLCDKYFQRFPADDDFTLMASHYAVILQKFNEADELLEKVENKESRIFLKERIFFYRSQERIGPAIPLYKKMLKEYSNPKDDFASFIVLGKYSFTLSDFSNSLLYFQKAAETNTASVYARLFQGCCHYKLKNKKMADDCFFEAYKIDPTHHTTKALLHGRKNNFENALHTIYTIMENLHEYPCSD